MDDFIVCPECNNKTACTFDDLQKGCVVCTHCGVKINFTNASSEIDNLLKDSKF